MNGSPSIQLPIEDAEAIARRIDDCCLSVEEIQHRITEALQFYNMGRIGQDYEGGKDRTKLAQALKAAEKLKGLVDGDGVTAAMHAAWMRRAEAGEAPSEPDQNAFYDMLASLDGAIADMQRAMDVPTSRGKPRDEAMLDLIADLAGVYEAATGSPMPYPSYDPNRDNYSPPFIRFLDYVSEATDCVFEDQPLTDEQIRHALRNLIDQGRITPKSAINRLSKTETTPLDPFVTNGKRMVTEDDRQTRKPN